MPVWQNKTSESPDIPVEWSADKVTTRTIDWMIGIFYCPNHRQNLAICDYDVSNILCHQL